MAPDPRASTMADGGRHFDRSGPLRLAAWGIAAVVLATAAILAARTDIGARRLDAAIASITGPAPVTQDGIITQLLARTADTERETRHLGEAVRSLTTERDRFATRVGMVEREMGDLTGSINRVRESITAPKPPAPGAGGDMQVPQNPPAVEAPGTRPAASLPAGSPVAAPAEADGNPPAAEAAEAAPVPLPRHRPPRRIAAAPPKIVAPPPAAEASAPAPSPAVIDTGDEAPSKVEIGVDLGPAASLQKLRARWLAFKAAHGSLVDGLQPVISLRDMGSGRPVELRLVVGPLADVEAATRFCAAIVGGPYACHPTVFDGQHLALR